MNTKLYDLVCIGNYTKDTIITPAGTKYVDGGAMNYSAHAANQLGLRVAVVTHLAREDQRVIDKFFDSGIDCFSSYSPASTSMKLEYPTNDPDIRNLTVSSTAEPICSTDVENLPTKSALVGSSFRGEVGLDVLQTLKEKKVFLGADMQGFVRVLRGNELLYESWNEMEIAFKYIDVIKSDAVEAASLTGEADLCHAAKLFSQMGPKEIVLTHKDGVLLYSGGEFHEAGFFTEQMNGRSGRGDTCIGAYMAMRRSLPPHEALLWAAAVTSLKMEKLGPFDRSKTEVIDLISKKYNHKLNPL